MPLATYRRKRDFTKTPEPRGRGGARKGTLRFVVQKHAATRLHYDFRLELDGVLKSWAVPKGPSLGPEDKRLAVEVEDHPIEYGGFEGTIPRGEYGAGAVIVWDHGTWTPLEDPKDDLARGRLKFELHGEKLRGAWMLVRMGGRASRGSDKPQWLLIKERDAHARPEAKTSIVDRLPKSVISGRKIEELDDPRRPAPSKPKRSVAGRRSTPAPTRRRRVDYAAIEGARPASLPRTFSPELATLVSEAPEGDGWLHELKLDGYRAIARLDQGKARMLTRRGQDWTKAFGTIAEEVQGLPASSALIDGEVVVLGPDGVTDFQRLQNALGGGADASELTYFAFDLMHADGVDLTRAPLERRKGALAALLAGVTKGGAIRYSDHVVGSGPEFHRAACARRLEGIIAKRRDSPYRSGRGRDWLKIKCAARQEFVIVGFTEPEGSRSGLGALLLGVHEKGSLRYAGRVGTGFTRDSLAELSRALGRLESPRPPVADAPRGAGIHWVRPKLVGEVSFTGWTNDGKLRHPSFQGLRKDKKAEDVIRERPMHDGEGAGEERAGRSARKARGAASPRRKRARGNGDGAPHARERARASARSAEGPGGTNIEGVTLSNPERVLYPDQQITKRDLAAYYALAGPLMLPHVEERPLMLKRCPEGIAKACFFQKHPVKGTPASLGRVPIRESKGVEDYLFVREVADLVALVQMGVLEVHVWGARVDRLEQPDRIVFDLDPDPAVGWNDIVAIACQLRERLHALELECFLKTTGGKGLHLVVPIERRLGWSEVHGFASDVAAGMAREQPALLTTVMSKAKRQGRIFIDTLRNARGATWVGAYSTRARDGATVSMPVRWEELGPKLAPDGFTIANAGTRIARGDPWAEMAKVRQRLTAAQLREAKP